MFFLNQIKDNYIFIYDNISFPLIISATILFYLYLRQLEIILKTENQPKPARVYVSFIPIFGQFYLGFKQRKIFFQSKRSQKINFRELVTLNNLNNILLVSFFLFLIGFYIAGIIFILSLFMLYYKINKTYADVFTVTEE